MLFVFVVEYISHGNINVNYLSLRKLKVTDKSSDLRQPEGGMKLQKLRGQS